MDLYLSLPEGTCKLFFSMTGERVRVLGSCRGLILIVTALPRRSTLRGIESESGERPRPRASAATGSSMRFCALGVSLSLHFSSSGWRRRRRRLFWNGRRRNGAIRMEKRNLPRRSPSRPRSVD